MIDLRKTAGIKPKDSKEDDFHLAVADYLYKELKSNGFKVTKNSVILKVALDNKYEDTYDNVVIDCLDGKLYLRGSQVPDRYLSKFRKFQGKLAGEAYHCVIQNAEKIIAKLKSFLSKIDDEELEVFGERQDMRKPKIKDMRKTSKIYDAYNSFGDYIEIFIDPTDKEISDTKNANNYGSIRGVIYSDGTKIIWPGSILHDQIVKKTTKSIDINQFRFAWDPSNKGWLLDSHGNTSKKTMEDFKANKEFLNRIGDVNAKIDIWYSSDYKDDLYFETTLEKYQQEETQQPQENVASIIDNRKKKRIDMRKIARKDMRKNVRKDLRKTAQIFHAFNHPLDNEYTEIFINPSDKEINDTKKADPYNSVRGVIYNDGTVYIWPGSILHNQIGEVSGKSIDIDQFRFAWEGDWLIDSHKKYTVEETMQLIIKHKDILNRIGNVNLDFDIVYATDINDTSVTTQSLEEYEQRKSAKLDMRKKVARKDMRKTAQYYTSFKAHEFGTVDMYINPSADEIAHITSIDPHHSLRAIYDGQNLYAWIGNILHNEIDTYLSRTSRQVGYDFTIKNETFRIDFDDKYCNINGLGISDMSDVRELLSKYPQLFIDTIMYEFYRVTDLDSRKPMTFMEVIEYEAA